MLFGAVASQMVCAAPRKPQRPGYQQRVGSGFELTILGLVLRSLTGTGTRTLQRRDFLASSSTHPTTLLQLLLLAPATLFGAEFLHTGRSPL